MLRSGVVGVFLVCLGCKAPPNEQPMSAEPTEPAPSAEKQPEPAPSAEKQPEPAPSAEKQPEPAPATAPEPATATATAPAPASDPGPEPVIPAGSADYSAVLADARAYKTGRIDFAALQRRVVARKLPPHKLGDGYLMMPVPAPPPGVPFDPMIMPSDWKGTFGEVAMTHFAGQITREEYDRLHRAAHPRCKP